MNHQAKEVIIDIYEEKVEWRKKELKDHVAYYFYIKGLLGERPLLRVLIPKNWEVRRLC